MFKTLKSFAMIENLRLWHMVVGFFITTAISFSLSYCTSQATLERTQRMAEASQFSNASQEFDNIARRYIRAAVDQSPDQARLRDEFAANMQRQYNDLDTAKLNLGPSGRLVAERYQKNLLSLTRRLNGRENAAELEPFMEELNVALQVREVVNRHLRSEAGLPVEDAASG